MIEIKIDNRTVEAHDGETVLQAALRNGIEIPHFCYHPCLSVAGNCRICLVKVDGRPKLVPSCNQAVAPGMVIETDIEEVREARAAVLQFIALDHPGECGICDKAGECRLQDYQQRYGEPQPLALEAQNHKPKFYEVGERILHDGERCVLCSRCVRFTQEVSGTHQLGIVERGSHARVQCLEEKTFDDPYGDNIVGLCPVGALLSRDFLYQSRVWYLEPVRSVCTGCARGCSVHVWRRKKEWQVSALGEELNRKAYRITPCDNAEINGPWLCNKGYDLHKAMSRERLLTPQVDGQDVSPEQALEKAADLLKNAKNPAILLSAHASNEELSAFQKVLGKRLTVYTPQSAPAQAGEVDEDDFLIRADKSPNRQGVQNLVGDRPFNGSAQHDLILAWGDETGSLDFGNAQVIRLASFATESGSNAAVLIPVSTTFERSGTFTNYDGKLNRFEPVFDAPASVWHAADVFGRLGA